MYSLAFKKQSTTPPVEKDDTVLNVVCVTSGAIPDTPTGEELSGQYKLFNNNGPTGTARVWYKEHSTFCICSDGEKWCLGDLGAGVYPLFVSEPVNGVQPENPADAEWIPDAGFDPAASMTISIG